MQASKLLHRILKFINYANLFKINEKCYFSIFWAILILFGLSDRTWWGLQNFYIEFWNSLIMQIYANLFKINEKCHLSSIQKSQQICTSGGDVYYASHNLLSTCSDLYHFHIPDDIDRESAGVHTPQTWRPAGDRDSAPSWLAPARLHCSWRCVGLIQRWWPPHSQRPHVSHQRPRKGSTNTECEFVRMCVSY